MWKAPQASAARPSSTSEVRQSTARAISAPYSQGPAGDAGDVGLVVLADVGGVGARDGALGAHPRDRHGGVEASGEGDADALADGQGGEDLAHGDVVLCGGGVSVVVGQGEEPAGERLAAGGVAGDDQEGVVAGDGAEHVAEVGLVEAAGQELGRPGRGAQHHQVGAVVGADQQVAAQPRQPVEGRGRLTGGARRPVAALGRDGVDERPGGAADLDRVELDEVAAQGGLGDVHAAAGEQLGELGLRAHVVVGHEVDDALVARALGGGAGRGVVHARSSSQARTAFWACRRFSASSQTTLLRAVEDGRRDLVAAVGRQAVHHDRPRGRVGEQVGGRGRTA